MQEDLTPKKTAICTSLDSVVIRKCIADIPGGRTLDTSEWTEKTILAGHFIGVKEDGTYFPCPVSGDAYTTLPEGAKFAGVNKHSMLSANPAAAIMTRGIVNPEAAPYKMDAVADAFAKDCPLVTFESDQTA